MTEAEQAARDAKRLTFHIHGAEEPLDKVAFDCGWKAGREYQGRWVVIRTEADLPKEAGIYYVTRRTDDGQFIVDRRGFVADGFYPRHWLITYTAWAVIPSEPEPYTPQEKP